jgi:ribulose-phosphate 3-epimerase
LGYEPPIVALGLAHAEPLRLPECLALADPDFDWLHFDVADGHFVPRLTYGAPMLALARRWSQAVFEAHLLVSNPAPASHFRPNCRSTASGAASRSATCC